MFGQNNNQDPTTDKIPDQSIDAAAAAASDQTWQHPGVPLDSSASAAVVGDLEVTSTTTPPAPAAAPAPLSVPAPSPVASPTPVVDLPTPPPAQADDSAANDLIDIKQQALSQLSPLVGQLDQSPEEKFRTLMMMIQASDDQNKIKDAYAAAQAITDEKARAQALLDVVNEINYFTQHQSPEA